MNIKLDLGTETTTYCKLLKGEENWMEAGMQNMSICIKTTNGYSGGLSSPYRGLTSPGLNNGLCFFSPASALVGALVPSAKAAPPGPWL